jgi:hypothetical protein
MLQNVKKEVKVGLFAILMLLIGWGVIRVLKGADLFGNTNTYYAYYEQVGGLQEASQVMLYGVKIGSVTKVTLSEDPTKGVELTMEIEKRYHLPVDSKAKIFNNGLKVKHQITIRANVLTNLVDHKEQTVILTATFYVFLNLANKLFDTHFCIFRSIEPIARSGFTHSKCIHQCFNNIVLKKGKSITGIVPLVAI